MIISPCYITVSQDFGRTLRKVKKPRTSVFSAAPSYDCSTNLIFIFNQSDCRDML